MCVNGEKNLKLYILKFETAFYSPLLNIDGIGQ